MLHYFFPVPPRLAPVMISKGTRAGMRAQITCLVQEGDLPITIFWLKDGQRLNTNSVLHISQLNDFSSVLVIERATADHSGNYTCAASNSARTSFSSASLNVTGGLFWLSHLHAV